MNNDALQQVQELRKASQRQRRLRALAIGAAVLAMLGLTFTIFQNFQQENTITKVNPCIRVGPASPECAKYLNSLGPYIPLRFACGVEAAIHPRVPSRCSNLNHRPRTRSEKHRPRTQGSKPDPAEVGCLSRR